MIELKNNSPFLSEVTVSCLLNSLPGFRQKIKLAVFHSQGNPLSCNAVVFTPMKHLFCYNFAAGVVLISAVCHVTKNLPSKSTAATKITIEP